MLGSSLKYMIKKRAEQNESAQLSVDTIHPTILGSCSEGIAYGGSGWEA